MVLRTGTAIHPVLLQPNRNSHGTLDDRVLWNFGTRYSAALALIYWSLMDNDPFAPIVYINSHWSYQFTLIITNFINLNFINLHICKVRSACAPAHPETTKCKKLKEYFVSTALHAFNTSTWTLKQPIYLKALFIHTKKSTEEWVVLLFPGESFIPSKSFIHWRGTRISQACLFQQGSCLDKKMWCNWLCKSCSTLLGTNISPPKTSLKMMFLFPR